MLIGLDFFLSFAISLIKLSAGDSKNTKKKQLSYIFNHRKLIDPLKRIFPNIN